MSLLLKKPVSFLPFVFPLNNSDKNKRLKPKNRQMQKNNLDLFLLFFKHLLLKLFTILKLLLLFFFSG